MKTLFYAAITLASFVGADYALDNIKSDSAFHLSVPTIQQVELDPGLIGSPLHSGFEPHHLNLIQGSPGPNQEWQSQMPQNESVQDGDTVYRCVDGSCCHEVKYNAEFQVDIPMKLDGE